MQLGTGWLGWTEQETLNTSIPTIELAFEGKMEFLRAMHGMSGGEPTPAPAPTMPPTDQVMNMFRRHAGP